MNLNKHLEFFNPIKIEEDVHIIGLGAIGSQVALMLTRLGLRNITIYDFDSIEEINLANQNYKHDQIGKTKIEATKENMLAINPELNLEIEPEGWQGQKLSGYVFLCLDNIDVRRAIVEAQRGNKYIKAIFDFRMGLADAQHYAADFQNEKAVKRLLETMDFTHEEAKQALPVSACGTSLSVLPTIWTIISAGIANFINFVKTNEYKHTILVNPFAQLIDAF